MLKIGFAFKKNNVLVETESNVKRNKTKLLNMWEFVVEVVSTLKAR